MDNNRYQPPKSGFDKSPRNREPGSLLKAVLFGAATDIGGTLVIQIVIGVVYGIMLASQGMSEAQMKEAFENIAPGSVVWLFLITFGLIMSGVAGFVCARTANVVSYNALGIVSAISVAYGTYMGRGDYDWPALLLLNMLGLCAIFIGGWWYIRRLAPRS